MPSPSITEDKWWARLTTSAGVAHAFLYDNGKMTDLGTLGGASSCALGVNDRGQVVGHADDARGVRRAFIYSGGRMKDLAAVGGTTSANGINAAGTGGWFLLSTTAGGRRTLFSSAAPA